MQDVEREGVTLKQGEMAQVERLDLEWDVD